MSKGKAAIDGLAVLACVALISGRAVSQDEKGGFKMPSAEEMQKCLDEMTRLGKPGEAHKALEPLIGKWDCVMRMGPQMESHGTSESKWVLDGRFVLSESEIQMQMPDPANPGKMTPVTMKGMGLTGYDNFRNMYFGNWASNMGTSILNFKGVRNPNNGVFTYYGEMDEAYVPGIGPVVGRYNRYVTKIVSNDKHVLSCYDLHAGEDYKAFEITYTRKK